MAFKTQKYELVEVPITSTQTRWAFPDQPKLRYTSLQALTTFSATSVTKSPLGNDVINISNLKLAYLTLYANDRNDVYRVPMIELNRVQNSATDPFVRSLFEFNGMKITWEKSYIEFASAPTISTAQSIILGVYYS
jgi:hypothetical protein